MDEKRIMSKLRIPPGKEPLVKRIGIALVLFLSTFFLYSTVSGGEFFHSGKPVKGASTAITGNTGYKYTYADEDGHYPESKKVRATFVTLVRNKDLWELLPTIKNVEDRFNRHFHYDWVFLNDEPFTQEFITTTTAMTSGKTKYGLIPREHWSYPEWIDQEKARLTREEMKKQKIIYGFSEPYRHMCRFESGFFYRQKVLDEYEYYWRVEPGTKLHCDVNYDVFKFMKDNGKKYGFTVSLLEYEATIKTLWQTTVEFIKKFPQHLAKNSMLDFISDDQGESYNLCHFWSNFEIASLDLWRGEAYSAYFDYLDHAGGFFYERWGDAPVHSIGAALFLDRDEIHHFGDLGYYHPPFHACPIDENIRLSNRCDCHPNKDFIWVPYSCALKYYNVNKLTKPLGWQEHVGMKV